MPDGSFSGATNEVSDKRFVWGRNDLSLMPTLYKNESIAFCSKVDDLEVVVLERFKDIGFSLGVHSIEYNKEKKMLTMSTEQNAIKGTSMQVELDKAKSKNIQIETINGMPVTESMLNTSGILTCLDEDATYKLGYYAGTYYTESVVTADTNFFVSYEIFATDHISYTKNGYLSITMPSYLKSGYYFINGFGFFKYIAEDKGTVDIASIDMNEETNPDEVYGIEVVDYASYTVNVPEVKENMFFKIELINEADDATATLVSPSGTEYNFNEEYEGMYTCYLGSVMAGTWTINITPATLSIDSVKLISVPIALQTYSSECVAELNEGDNVTFKVSYDIIEKASTYNRILCVLVDPMGNVYNFSNDTKNKILTCHMPYSQDGMYTVKTYYYADYVEIKNYSCTTIDGNKIEMY